MFYTTIPPLFTPDIEDVRQNVSFFEVEVFTPCSSILGVNTVTGTARTVTALALITYFSALGVLSGVIGLVTKYVITSEHEHVRQRLRECLICLEAATDELSRGIIESIPFFGSVAASWIDGPIDDEIEAPLGTPPATGGNQTTVLRSEGTNSPRPRSPKLASLIAKISKLNVTNRELSQRCDDLIAVNIALSQTLAQLKESHQH